MNVVYIAIGAHWTAEAAESIASLRRWHRDAFVTVVGETVKGADDVAPLNRGRLSPVELSRYAKVCLPGLLFGDTPARKTALYIDADTEICGRLDGWLNPLDAGAEMVITPSGSQGRRVMQHIMQPERAATFDELGEAVQLQAGVFAWRDTAGTRALWEAWRVEWERWRGADQGALMRALARTPVRLWFLGRDFNGGSVIRHRSAGG